MTYAIHHRDGVLLETVSGSLVRRVENAAIPADAIHVNASDGEAMDARRAAVWNAIERNMICSR